MSAARDHAPRAVVTALVDTGAGADLAAIARDVEEAAAALGLTVHARRPLGPDAFELDAALPASPAPPAPSAPSAPSADATHRIEARRLRRELGAALAVRRPDTIVDLAVQLDRPPPRAPRLFVMDMDSTVITIEVIDELARRHGVGAEVAAITARAMAGELDFEASLRARVARLAGLPAAVLDDVAGSLPLTDGAARLVRAVHALGGWTAIVSGGFTFGAEPLAARLGIDHVAANRLAIAGGALTGELVGELVVPTRKAELVGELAAAHGLDLAHTVAIGDGANDLLMLARAGLGVAFHGKPLVRAAADTAITRGGLDRVLQLVGLSAADVDALAA
ncbi:MAG TPA: phosphoserine phosphatase SerB [Kofleriaceae bacterium]|nr:phosphoserine phosphatase SerB [Kofleriaceae bacterium]